MRAPTEFGLRRHCVERLPFFVCFASVGLGLAFQFSFIAIPETGGVRICETLPDFVSLLLSVCVGCAYINQCKRGMGMFCASARHKMSKVEESFGEGL